MGRKASASHVRNSNVDGEDHPFSDLALSLSYEGSAASRALRSFQWATQNRIPDSKFPHGLHSVWFDIVSRYSELALSVVGDKLVALAGVAERIIAARSGEEYLAGLWRSTFLSDFLWHLDYLRARPQLPEFRAPTWSWASVEDKVRGWNWMVLRNAEISFMASLVDVTIITHPKDRHKTGKVYGSRLEMKGRLRRVPSSCSQYTHDMFTHNIHYDTKELQDLVWKRSWNERNAGGTDDGPEVYYMPVRSIREMDHRHLHRAEISLCECGIVGLLVMKVDDGFERVGLFAMSATHWRNGFRDTAMFDSEIFSYFDDCEEERIVFLDGICRSQAGGSAGITLPTSPS